ncbi:hypothetical protein BDV25DRAFT_49225 [Aspergillus avenaceus]|uniref:ATP-grasp domain-containing protein n=1 Tax=Aspergillus avenaceus TaxID=36643 RepID=A0A5N6TKA0_ASPAV|nr:hypothetical protein BDV25DRAFT_49225 [Aspergillus avenaceus]
MMNGDVPRLRIALIAEQQSAYRKQGYSVEECAALTHDGEVQGVMSTLEKLGHHVTLVPGIQSLVKHLAVGANKDWDLAFNMSQGFHGVSRESQVPALLEAYQTPHTFADAATMALCQSKANTKITLAHHNIPTAPFAVISAKEKDPSLPEFTTSVLNYPLFIKPVTEGSSKGIDGFNKVNEPAELKPAVQTLRSYFPGQDILVESFLSGRELSVSILGTGTLSQVIGVTEFYWQKSDATKHDFASRQSKASSGDERLVRNDAVAMDDPQVQAACQVALDAWNVCGCRDAGRVDIRFDAETPDAIPNVLEINPISGLLRGHSPLPASAEGNGMSFEALLAAIIESALQRTPLETRSAVRTSNI